MGNRRYNIPAVSLDISKLSLQYISTSKYEDDWPSAMHSHQCTELFFVVAGRGRFEINDTSLVVTENDMIIINPNVPHTETATSSKPLEYIVVGLEGADFLGKASKDLRYSLFSCGNVSTELLFYLQEMLAEVKSNSAYSENVAHGLLHILVSKLQRHMELSVTENLSTRTSLESAQIKRYIDNHFKDDITLDTLAKTAHLNKFYLSHSFKRNIGISPINYLIERRLKESKFLLADTDHSIAQIAQFVGFSSQSYFSQCFNRVEDMSPREYRKNTRTKK